MSLRLLADENIPAEAVEALRHDGHDGACVAVDMPAASDMAILQEAQAEGRTVLTFDKDFGELAFRSGSLLAVELPCSVLNYAVRLTRPESWWLS